MRGFRVSVSMILIASAWSVAVRAEGPPLAARWIDAESVLAYAEVREPEAVIDRLEGDRVVKLLKAVPGFERALERENARQFLDALKFVATSLDTTPEEGLRKLVGGGIVMAVEGKAKPERVYLAITPRDRDFLEKAHAKLVELARQDAESKGKPAPIKQKEYRGIMGYSLDKNEAHAIIEGMLVIANGGDALKEFVDRVEGPDRLAKPFAEVVTSARGPAAKGSSTAWAYVRLDRLRVVSPKDYAPERINPGALFLFGPWAEAARHGDWMAADLTWTADRLGLEVSLPKPAQDYTEGMRGFLPGEDKPATTTPLRPPGALLSGTLWRDFGAVWEARGAIFPAEQQQGFAQLDTFAGQFFGGRDFGSGVLGALGTHWQVVVARQDVTSLAPVPDVVLPAFAVVIDLKEEDIDFAQRLKAAFQSFIGLANLGAAETKAPPLMLGSEDIDGVTISTARYLPRPNRPEGEPVHQRHNFSPSAVQVDHHFIISSSLGLAKDLVRALKAPAAPVPATLVIDVDGAEVGKLIEQNREELVTRNIVEKGNGRERAEQEVDLLKQLAEYLGRGSLHAVDGPDGPRFSLQFELGR